MSFTVDSRPGSQPSILDNDPRPDLRARVLRLYLLFAALIMVVVLLGSLVVKRQLEADARAAEAAFAATLAGQLNAVDAVGVFDTAVPSALQVAGMDGPIIASLIDDNRDPAADYRSEIDLQSDPDWNSWQRLVLRTADPQYLKTEYGVGNRFG